MPFMHRITNSGVALHAGDLPGYPASHGCIRLPYSFARNLFGITDIGARVIVSNDDLTPAEFHSTRLIAPLPPDRLAQTDAPERVATAEMMSGTQSDVSNIIGVTPVAAGSPEQPRTREAAAAARAAEREQRRQSRRPRLRGRAIDHVKATTDAAREARTRSARRATRPTVRRSRTQAAREAARPANLRISRESWRRSRSKLTQVELDKQSADELAEEASSRPGRLSQRRKGARRQAGARHEEGRRCLRCGREGAPHRG
jgi:hypothetical protein